MRAVSPVSFPDLDLVRLTHLLQQSKTRHTVG